MTDTTPQPPGPQSRHAVVWPLGLRATGYANVTAITTSPWDFSIFFGQVDTPIPGMGPPSTDVEAQPLAGVKLGPVAVRVLLDQLNEQIAIFENLYGRFLVRELKSSPLRPQAYEHLFRTVAPSRRRRCSQ